MSVIEFIGMDRAGKSTTAKYLAEHNPAIIYHPERHDLVPEEFKDDVFQYNLWYAKYCTEELEKVLKTAGIHLFERGVIDRIIIGKVHFKMGWFTEEQLEEYLAVLNPYIDKVDKIFVFRIPVEVSVQRAKKMGKDVSEAISYMNNLYQEYSAIKNWIPKAIFLPENASLKDLEELTTNFFVKEIL